MKTISSVTVTIGFESAFESFLLNRMFHISCQYLNLLKILYIKRISHCFRYCQRLRYIAAICNEELSGTVCPRPLKRHISFCASLTVCG